jgi:hypothetical protein
MDSMNGRLDPSANTLGSVVSAIARFVVALVGALLMVGALLFGLLVGLTLMLFALLRGRRPRGVQFAWRKGDWPGRAGRWREARTVESGEVVDIEAREVAPHERQVR